MDAGPKGLVFERERVIAKLLGTTTILLLLSSCTVTKTININIMAKKQQKVSTSPYSYKPSKGITIQGDTKTIQDDSLSIKEMLQKHVQGVLDPSEMSEGQYHDENIDHDTDIEDISQKTELDLLQYAKDNAMTEQEIQDYIKENSYDLTPDPEPEPQPEPSEDPPE